MSMITVMTQFILITLQLHAGILKPNLKRDLYIWKSESILYNLLKMTLGYLTRLILQLLFDMARNVIIKECLWCFYQKFSFNKLFKDFNSRLVQYDPCNIIIKTHETFVWQNQWQKCIHKNLRMLVQFQIWKF